MKPLTRKEIAAALGDIDNLIVTKIINTGATADELAEARAWLVDSEPLINTGKPLASGRVGRLVEILDTIEADEVGPAGHRI
jgi:hypothetical protein